MDLTLAAVVIMGGWVVAMVAAGTVMSLRPGGTAVRFTPAGAPAASVSGRREEILLGGEAEVLGNVRGTVQAVQIRADNRRLLAIELAAARGLDGHPVPADAILSADGRVVRLAEAATESPDGAALEAATLRRDMAVRGSDGKRLGGLRLICFDPASRTVTALVVAGRGTPSLRLLPIERVREAGPNGIATDLPSGDWAKLPTFATDWEIKQAIIEQLTADPTLRDVQRSLTIEVHDQVVTLRGYVADQSEAERVARIIRSVPSVMQVDRKLITDDDMARALTDAIRSDPGTRAADVQVSAHHGTVDISGIAPDPATARMIESVASRAPGVQVVHNTVTIRPAA
ncbi:MAG: BON domain-containing protein [Candidatus Dormibacteraeota bacterium]|nr:BON domain-containing protein [Candidatus Dormibacteraeota bacterium]